jgi:hypothetical protein
MKRIGTLWLAAVVAAGLAMTLMGCGGGGGGNGPPPLPEVAVLTNEAANEFGADVVEKLEATGQFSRVDTVNAAFSTPALSQLQGYDGILVYIGDHVSSIADTTTLGDVMADYVDQGGGLVVAVLAVGHPSWPELALGGRYVSQQYFLIPRVSYTLGSQTSGAVLDSTHPIMAGFTSFHGGSSSARADTTAVVSGTVILEWADGKPLVVTGEISGVRRVDLNFYPPSSNTDSRYWDTSTDGDLLMANSLTWVADMP